MDNPVARDQTQSVTPPPIKKDAITGQGSPTAGTGKTARGQLVEAQQVSDVTINLSNLSPMDESAKTPPKTLLLLQRSVSHKFEEGNQVVMSTPVTPTSPQETVMVGFPFLRSLSTPTPTIEITPAPTIAETEPKEQKENATVNTTVNARS